MDLKIGYHLTFNKKHALFEAFYEDTRVASKVVDNDMDWDDEFFLFRSDVEKEVMESVKRRILIEYLDRLKEKSVVHAHWTRKRTLSHDGELYCSNCEWTPEMLGVTTLGDLQLADVYHCPHCGAKMDEEVDTDDPHET